jgi:hypothetical protein
VPRLRLLIAPRARKFAPFAKHVGEYELGDARRLGVTARHADAPLKHRLMAGVVEAGEKRMKPRDVRQLRPRQEPAGQPGHRGIEAHPNDVRLHLMLVYFVGTSAPRPIRCDGDDVEVRG